VVLVALRWRSVIDDAAVSVITENIRTRFIAVGKEMGLFHLYKYQNYASKAEDVFAGYGTVSRARLRKIKDAYDPRGSLGRECRVISWCDCDFVLMCKAVEAIGGYNYDLTPID
jgi:hypothetical protein